MNVIKAYTILANKPANEELTLDNTVMSALGFEESKHLVCVSTYASHSKFIPLLGEHSDINIEDMAFIEIDLEVKIKPKDAKKEGVPLSKMDTLNTQLMTADIRETLRAALSGKVELPEQKLLNTNTLALSARAVDFMHRLPEFAHLNLVITTDKIPVDKEQYLTCTHILDEAVIVAARNVEEPEQTIRTLSGRVLSSEVQSTKSYR